jgi:hypothetical protein
MKPGRGRELGVTRAAVRIHEVRIYEARIHNARMHAVGATNQAPGVATPMNGGAIPELQVIVAQPHYPGFSCCSRRR